MNILMISYLGIVGLLLLLSLWGLFKEKDFDKAIGYGIVCIPLILRLFLIK